jgi:predicted dehydrogenase
VEQLRHFLAVIARREEPLVSADDAMGTLAVIEAIKEAARTGERIAPAHLAG